MRWVRHSPGIYDSADDRFHITFIPAHWEVVMDGTEGEGADVWDAATLAEAKWSCERWVEEPIRPVPLRTSPAPPPAL